MKPFGKGEATIFILKRNYAWANSSLILKKLCEGLTLVQG